MVDFIETQISTEQTKPYQNGGGKGGNERHLPLTFQRSGRFAGYNDCEASVYKGAGYLDQSHECGSSQCSGSKYYANT